ncbi:uncharacterized protein LOC108741647 [Agrilus planipennis]|uniref:Uncharacterized protein LOC108741647 n=1 Tax=Agrilus planipennis TaxID=224129 RepID=A0A1W4X7K0_AGRPL|nr:uncharacterized protein LOC108741647 [Agrilus planipennis]
MGLIRLHPQGTTTIRSMPRRGTLSAVSRRAGSVLERPASNFEVPNTRNPGISGILSLGNFEIRISRTPKLCFGVLGICISKFLGLSIPELPNFVSWGLLSSNLDPPPFGP